MQVSLWPACESQSFEDSGSSRHSDLVLQAFLLYIDDFHMNTTDLSNTKSLKIGTMQPKLLDFIFHDNISPFNLVFCILSALTERFL